MQGQSIFGAEGDTGAFDCIRSDGTTIVNVLDPPSQPWVTSVGGTSFENYNPGETRTRAYPSGDESVWNVDNLCSNARRAANDNLGGFFWCGETGAGGGGSSQWWGRPFYQSGPGVNNPNTTYGNGTTQCALAKAGTPCREDPTSRPTPMSTRRYAEYCTGNASTPFSVCGLHDRAGPAGSVSAARASRRRSGRRSSRTATASRVPAAATSTRCCTCCSTSPEPVYFHDITGIGQTTNNNGLFPITPGYDEATGIGTPNWRRSSSTAASNLTAKAGDGPSPAFGMPARLP